MLRICCMNKDRFMDCVEHCEGNVYLHLADGGQCNLKQNSTASALIRLLDMPKTGLEIDCSAPEDMPRFMQYLMEAAR